VDAVDKEKGGFGAMKARNKARGALRIPRAGWKRMIRVGGILVGRVQSLKGGTRGLLREQRETGRFWGKVANRDRIQHRKA